MTVAVVVGARWRQVQHLVQALACLGFLLSNNGVNASSSDPSSAAASGIIPTNYYNKAVFQMPWEEGVSEGLQHLEHIFVAIPTQAMAKKLYYDVLGFAPDARRLHNLQRGSGTIWANIGISQVHIGEGDPQVVPGTIGFVYPDLTEVVSRLKEERFDAFDGTKFTWQERSDDTLEIVCPFGNVLHLHQSTLIPAANETTAPPTSFLDPRGGRIPSLSSVLGLGMAYAHFRVKLGTAAGLARFYREVLGAEVKEIGTVESADEATCSMAGTCDSQGPTTGGAFVRVGPVQHLGFVEVEEALPEYDGHHICLYMTDKGFQRSFLNAKRMDLVFGLDSENTDTLEKALDSKQYRIKNLVDPSTGDLLHVLGHEIRSTLHPEYPVGRNVSID